MAAEERGKEEDEPAGPLARAYGWCSSRLALLIVAGVVAGAVASRLLLPSITSLPAGSNESLLPSHPSALAISRRSQQIFGLPVLTPYAVVQRAPGRLSPAVQERTVARALRVDRGDGPPGLRHVFALPIVNTLGVFPGSREASTTAITYLYFPDTPPTGVGYGRAQRYAAYLGPNMDVIGTTGAAPARLEQFRVLQDRIHWTELTTVAVIMLIVGIAFRSLVAPLVTVLTAAVAFVISERLIGLFAEKSGLSIPNEMRAVAVALMLGIVTDYSVFFFTGMRRRLREGQPRREALRWTAAQNGPIVLIAGLIVSFGTGTLMLGSLGFFRSFGPGMSITVATGLAVSLLLVPALLALLGEWAFWPGLRRGPADVRDWQLRVARFQVKKPVSGALVVLAGAALLFAATGLRKYDLGFGPVRGLPPGNEVARASAAASTGFAPGIVAPTELLLQSRGIGDRRRALGRLQRLLAVQPHVAGVIGPATLPLDRRFGVVTSTRGNAARYAIVFDRSPTDAPAIGALAELQEKLPPLLREAGLQGVDAGFGGETALALETVDATNSSYWRVMLAALGVNLVFLLFMLRSIVASLYLLLASALSLAATFGLTLYFFSDVVDFAGLPYYLPIAFSVLLLSLGSDYNVFIVGRIWREAKRRRLPEAVAAAVPRAGRSVTIAGLALALSFAALAMIPIGPFAVFAFAMSVGITIDAFVVRSLLVPGLIVLFGRLGRRPRRRRP